LLSWYNSKAVEDEALLFYQIPSNFREYKHAIPDMILIATSCPFIFFHLFVMIWFPQYAIEVAIIPITKATTTSGSPRIRQRINPTPPTTHTGQTILLLLAFGLYIEIIELDTQFCFYRHLSFAP
jgi:hypothetical protein